MASQLQLQEAASHETIRIAHTARCKLHIAANNPNRDFRFILGHALTLDKLMLRIAEIEIDSSDSDEDGVASEEPHGPATTTDHQPRRVSFSSQTRHTGTGGASSARRSPPPPVQSLPHPGDDDEEVDDAAEDDEDDDGLGLTRYGSAAGGRAPALEEDTGDQPEDNEPVTPTDDELRALMIGDGSPELKAAYQHVAGCACHGQDAPHGEKVWEIPGEEGGKRRAVVQVMA